ncbi:Os01g0945150 [Oryza sativa Japonica Group]|uniref:Os01g0945150 protein n=1 Tax=Oryza sativa subsp. japonica TaxID=39947 RepID=A0A0N7KEE4_ORYSJ|nr:hypothetical protein EE612_007929 [Oryza sativa]BAS76185.1 Os01g0945150 [Oryza sativa Japonica Group]
MYIPSVAIEPIAWNATWLPSDVRAMTNATATPSQTTLRGTSCLFTRYHTRDNGIAPSLEKASVTHLELLVTHAMPQRKTATATAPKQTIPPTPLPYLRWKAVYRACAMA